MLELSGSAAMRSPAAIAADIRRLSDTQARRRDRICAGARPEDKIRHPLLRAGRDPQSEPLDLPFILNTVIAIMMAGTFLFAMSKQIQFVSAHADPSLATTTLGP
jgi:hypothetical protein